MKINTRVEEHVEQLTMRASKHFLAIGIVLLLLAGLLLGWRWILGTAIVFGGLVFVNEVYMHWPFGTT